MRQEKLIRTLLWVVMAAVLTGCVKNEFKVTFNVGADVNRTYTLVYYASDRTKGRLVESVVNLQKGNGEMPGMIVNPCLVYLFVSGAQSPQAVFYVERGDEIRVTGSGSDPVGWKISGNKITDALTGWRLSNKAAIEGARKAGGAAAVNSAVTAYVKAHPEDPVSTLLMLCYFDRRADEALFRRTWALLKGEAAEAKWKELTSRSDMLADVPMADKLPARIVLNTIATGCDTIETGRVPMIIYFAKNNVESYHSDIDTLRQLTREYRDSARRIIADISLEPDSLARWYTARGDSLHHAVRGWMPLGVSDSLAKAMGVSRVPYVIVAARGGAVLYRGDDMKTAAGKFRGAMK